MTPHDEAAFRDFQLQRRMADALASVPDLLNAQDILIALRMAGYPQQTIKDHVAGAVEIEHDRRFMRRYVGDMEQVA